MLTPNKAKTLIHNAPSNANILPYKTPWKNGIVIIPMLPTNGFIWNTEQGQFGLDKLDQNWTTWKELIAYTNGDLQVVWDGALSGETKQTTYTTPNGQTAYTDKAQLKITSGKYCFGYQEGLEGGFEIQADPSYKDFNTIIENESFTIIIPNDKENNPFNLDFDNFRFYMFPEQTSGKVFLIESITTHYAPNDTTKIVSYEITFSHLQNKLQKSGKAIEEYFHLSCVGGWYPWPYINRQEKKITIDKSKLEIHGVNYVREEYYNACIHFNSSYYGWRVVEGTNGGIGTISKPTQVLGKDDEFIFDLYQPEYIFPRNFQLAPTNVLAKKTTPEVNFDILGLINFTETQWSDWKTRGNQQITQDFDSKYEGELRWGKDTIDGTGDQHNGYWAKTLTIDQFGDRINDISKIKYFARFNCNAYIETIQSDDSKSYCWEDINLFNTFALQDTIVLPWYFTLHQPNLLKDWFLIGGLFSKITGGFPLGYDRQFTSIWDNDGNLWNKSITGIVSSAFLNASRYGAGKENEQNPERAFLNDFYKSNDSGDKFNNQNRNMSFNVELTDLLQFRNKQFFGATPPTNYYVRTRDLGQQLAPHNFDYSNRNTLETIDPTNNAYYLRINNEVSVVNNQADTPLAPISEKPKYVICGFMNKNFGATGQKLTFFDSGFNSIWQGAFQTQSNFVDCSREITNIYLLNFFNTLALTGQAIDYPIVPPMNKYTELDNIEHNELQNLKNIEFVDNRDRPRELNFSKTHGYSFTKGTIQHTFIKENEPIYYWGGGLSWAIEQIPTQHTYYLQITDTNIINQNYTSSLQISFSNGNEITIQQLYDKLTSNDFLYKYVLFSNNWSGYRGVDNLSSFNNIFHKRIDLKGANWSVNSANGTITITKSLTGNDLIYTTDLLQLGGYSKINDNNNEILSERAITYGNKSSINGTSQFSFSKLDLTITITKKDNTYIGNQQISNFNISGKIELGGINFKHSPNLASNPNNSIIHGSQDDWKNNINTWQFLTGDTTKSILWSLGIKDIVLRENSDITEDY